jgi:hypothetical protein
MTLRCVTIRSDPPSPCAVQARVCAHNHNYAPTSCFSAAALSTAFPPPSLLR